MTKGLNPLLLRGDNRFLSQLASHLGKYDHCIANKERQNAANYAAEITDLLRGRPAPKNPADAMMTQMLSR